MLVRAKRYKSGTSSEAPSIGTNDFSITKCIVVLQTINLLNSDKYLKVVEKFIDLDWEVIFMNMFDERKKAWLNMLQI